MSSDEPLHRQGKTFERQVREWELDAILDNWAYTLVTSGSEAAGPYPHEAWRERYYPTPEEDPSSAQRRRGDRVFIVSTRRQAEDLFFRVLHFEEEEGGFNFYRWDAGPLGLRDGEEERPVEDRGPHGSRRPGCHDVHKRCPGSEEG